MKHKTPPPIEPCAHCGHAKADHTVVNYSDAGSSKPAVLLCPTAVWQAAAEIEDEGISDES